jgi:Holliday junction DNA helicase RuvA
LIGKLTGRVDSVSGNQLILDVGGVGYLVACSAATLRAAGGQGAQNGSFLSLFIETHVREDAINLYGFANEGERDAFRLLTGVQGVGAKSALAILGVLPPEKLAQAIAAQDKASLTQADGVGPKLALRIVTELKDKAALLGAVFVPKLADGIVSNAGGGAVEDAVSALLNLGYKRMEAFAAVMKASEALGGKGDLPALLRGSLAELGKREGGAG